MSRDEFKSFLRAVLTNVAAFSKDGSIHYLFMDWRHNRELQEVGEEIYDELKAMTVWVKDNGGMGTFYRSRHELVFVFKLGTAPHINTFELGQFGRYRTNVWNYRGINSGGRTAREELAMHPTVKPVAMIADALRDCSRRGGIVLDAFCGSGTILIAAEKTGRRGRAIEIDPLYCDTSIRRWQTYAKDDAVLVATGETFAEVEARRAFERAAVIADESSPQAVGALSGLDPSSAAVNAKVVTATPAIRRKSPWSSLPEIARHDGITQNISGKEALQ